MNNDRPLILISNDDGVNAKGIRELVGFLRPLADLVVMAPDAPRSGFACSITCHEPVSYKLVHEEPGLTVYQCSGTPTDCVKLAFYSVLKRIPDLVVGGINHGDNSSVNNHYSGTMGIAKEGCLKGIPSIAFSSCFYNEDANLEPLRPYVEQIVSKVLAEGLPNGVCLNVNFPATETFKGVKVCRMTRGSWINEIVKEHHPRGYDYFWVVGEYRNDEPQAEDSDQWALNHGYVAITPTTIDVTAYDFMDTVRGWDIK